MNTIIIICLVVVCLVYRSKYIYYKTMWENGRPEMWESGEDRFD